MRKLFSFITLVLCSLFAPSLHAAQRAWGYCTQGGIIPTVSGLQLQNAGGTATQAVQASYPGCTVTVYFAGTLIQPTIFADSGLTTVKANPFTADSNTGYWFFYALDGRYDVQLSGAGIVSTFTLGDILLNTSAGGGGGGGNTTSVNLTPNVLPKSNAPNGIINSLLTDTGTILQYTGTSGITSPFLTATNLTNGNCLQAGSGGLITTVAFACGAGGGSTPGLPFNSLQYNASGSLGGTSGMTWSSSASALTGASGGFLSPIFSTTTANPALTGIVRLSNADFISWRNAANSGDILLFKQTAAAGNIPADTIESSAGLGAVFFTDALGGTAVAGQIRLASASTVNWRNNANGADVSLSKNTSDNLVFPNGLSLGGGTALATTNQTGTGNLVLANTPTLVTPVLGAATGTSLNLGATQVLSTTSQSGTGSICMTTNCSLTTPTVTTTTFTTSSELHFLSTNGTNFTGLKGSGSTVNLVWSMPVTDSSGTQCLSSNGSQVLAWSACSAGTGTPGGSDTNVQVNNTGSFGGFNTFTFNKTDTVTIGLLNTTLGKLVMTGNTSGSVTLQTNAVAGSGIVLTLPSVTGTLASSGTAPISVTSGTGAITCTTCTTNAAAATANQLMIGGGAQAISALGSLGTTTTVLHGNAGGAPSFGAVSLTTDVSGILPIANGGTSGATASAGYDALSPTTTRGDIAVRGASSNIRLALGANGLCLLSNGTDLVYGSCAAGAVGGNATSGQMAFWNGTASITGSANNLYSAASGYTVIQGANSAEAFYMKRFTDTAPTGNFMHFQNNAGNADMFKVDVLGNLTIGGSLTFLSSTAGTLQLTQGTAPSLVANTIQLIAPTVVAASGEQFVFPNPPTTGFIRWTNSAGVLSGGFVPASGVGACAGSGSSWVVTANNDNAPPTCNNVSAAMFASQNANTVLVAPNGSAGIPTFRVLGSADIPPSNLASNANGGVSGILPIANGGTNAATAAAGFNNLSPMTTAGDIIYGGTSGAANRLAAGTSTQVLHSGTTPAWGAVVLTTDVSGILPIANGGTNTSTTGNTNGVFYFDGTKFVSTATGGAGTLCLVSTAGGTPSFGSCSGSSSTSWSNLTNPSADLSLSMGTNNSLFTSGVMTGTRNAWEFVDGNSTSTGSMIFTHTGASSTMKPFTATAQGTANGVQMNTSGVLAAIGTGGITATATSLNIVTNSPITGGQSPFNANMTLGCATCVTSGSALTNNLIVIGSGGGQGTASLASGTSGQILQSKGSSAPAWITFPNTSYAPAANCVNTVAGSAWSTGATPAALCRAGTNNLGGLLSPWGASDTGQVVFHIDADTDLTTNLPSLMLEITSTDTTNAHTIIMQESISCAKEDGSTTDDVAFNAARSFGTITLNANANRMWQANINLNSTDVTGCTAPGLMIVKISRTTDTATNVGIYGLSLTQMRLLTVQAN